MMRANNMRVVLGSALLWAWGFLCFLSPALFPERGGLDASIGLEYGFFASQARCWYAPASWCLCRAGGASS